MTPRIKNEVLQFRFESHEDITMEEAAFDLKSQMFTAVYGLRVELKKIKSR